MTLMKPHIPMIAFGLLAMLGAIASAQSPPVPAAPLPTVEAASSPTLPAAKAPTQNIILFLIDDLGWSDLGCQGSSYYRTPNIDRLAASGIRFTNAYAACAVCSPTRAALLTGKYPARLLLTDWLPSGRWDPKSKLHEGRFLRSLPTEEMTLAEALRDHGYRTASIGKWHLGSEPFSLPEHHGFDVSIGGNAHGAPGSHFFPYAGDWAIPATGRRATWNVLPDGKPGEYLTDRLTDEAIAFVRESRDQPFFLYLPQYAVHTPLEGKPDLVAPYERVPKDRRQGKPPYAAMVESVDQSVGRVVAALQELGLDQNTWIVFTSDNGGFYNATSNAPLRANKGAYYEGGIRVPLIITGPGVKRPGDVIDTPVITTDLYPTLLAAAALPPRPNQHLDGIDLSPLWKTGQPLPARPLFWHYPHYNEHPSSHPCSVIRSGDWKLIETFDPPSVELFNLAADLGETKDLASSEPDRVTALQRQLDAWRDDVGAERMRPNPDYDPSATRPKTKGSKKRTARDGMKPLIPTRSGENP
jgi:arylsulfatase A